MGINALQIVHLGLISNMEDTLAVPFISWMDISPIAHVCAV
jgi:hypothetical protein